MNEATRPRWFSPLRKLLVTIAVAAVTMSLFAPPHLESASAVSTAGFDAGNIISDAQFYDGSSMTVKQIQSFLTKQLSGTRDGRCTIGDSGRKAGQAWGGTKIASACLKDMKFKALSRSSNAYCKSVSGGASQSPAQILAAVGKACGISPKVLLITLEKEQSLITDTWPTVRQYNVATGYACPDDGPNNSANCNSAYSGFANQVYWAAWQLKVYKANPNSFNYRPYQTNTIQWHPNISCGTSRVYIENAATAALYIYTPYRPNAAALRAGNGTGDACSSYGNRNFYLLYNSWFGSTQAIPVSGKIKSFFNAQGGASAFGTPTKAQVTHLKNGGGFSQQFTKGVIAHSTGLQKTVFIPNGRILTSYQAAKGPDGTWGWPRFSQTYVKSEGTKYQRFNKGMAVANAARGVKFVPNQTLHVWNLEGAGAGNLGYPLDQATVLSGTTAYQRFENGTVIRGTKTKLALTRAEAARWRNAGGQPKLGLPTSHQRAVPGQGWYIRTQKGVLFTQKVTNSSIFVPKGALLTHYLAAGGPAAHGWPKTALNCSLPQACKLPLQTKDLVSSSLGSFFVDKAQYKYWMNQGDRFTTLGYPTSDTKHPAGGTLQRYANGVVSIPNGTSIPVRLDRGKIFVAYIKSGWHQGPWGLLQRVSADQQKAWFENGTATIENGSVVFSANPAGRQQPLSDTGVEVSDPDSLATIPELETDSDPLANPETDDVDTSDATSSSDTFSALDEAAATGP